MSGALALLAVALATAALAAFLVRLGAVGRRPTLWAALAAGGAVALVGFAVGAVTPAMAGLVAAFAAAACVDLGSLRIPNVVSAFAFSAALAAGLGHAPESLVGALVLAAVGAVTWRVGGMGLGDAKLLAAVGAAFGPIAGLMVFALAAMAGGVVQLLGRLAGGDRPTRFAFAPYLAAVLVLALLTVGRHAAAV